MPIRLAVRARLLWAKRDKRTTHHTTPHHTTHMLTNERQKKRNQRVGWYLNVLVVTWIYIYFWLIYRISCRFIFCFLLLLLFSLFVFAFLTTITTTITIRSKRSHLTTGTTAHCQTNANTNFMPKACFPFIYAQQNYRWFSRESVCVNGLFFIVHF